MLDTILLALLITAIGRIICASIVRKMDKDLDEFVRNFPKNGYQPTVCYDEDGNTIPIPINPPTGGSSMQDE